MGRSAYISAPRRDGKVDVEEAAAVRRLVRAASAGDRDAFGELYRMHHAAIHRMARFRLGETAEEAVSETFLRAWSGLPRYRDTGAPFAAWLYGIARHVIADEFRRRARSEPRAEVPDRVVDERPEDRLALQAAMEGLPDEQRQVIELKYLVGLTNAEVGSALGKSTGAVNALQWRALKTMKAKLG